MFLKITSFCEKDNKGNALCDPRSVQQTPTFFNTYKRSTKRCAFCITVRILLVPYEWEEFPQLHLYHYIIIRPNAPVSQLL